MITVDDYVIDAALREGHTLDNQVTTHPIEKGAITTDHSYEMPDEITFDCVVSDHPIAAVAVSRGSEVDGLTPSGEAYERLRFIRKRGTPVTVTSSLGVHENMMLVRLSIPRSADDGESLRFSFTFRKAEFVENERTVVRIAVPQQAKRVNRGAKPAKTPPETPPAPAEEERASILWKLVN
jgi:hypothetical protein